MMHSCGPAIKSCPSILARPSCARFLRAEPGPLRARFRTFLPNADSRAAGRVSLSGAKRTGSNRSGPNRPFGRRSGLQQESAGGAASYSKNRPAERPPTGGPVMRMLPGRDDETSLWPACRRLAIQPYPKPIAGRPAPSRPIGTRRNPGLFMTPPSRDGSRSCSRGVLRPSAPQAYSPVR